MFLFDMIFTHLRCLKKNDCGVNGFKVGYDQNVQDKQLWGCELVVVFIYISYYNTVEACFFFCFLVLRIYGGDNISISRLPADMSVFLHSCDNCPPRDFKPHESGTDPNDQIGRVVAVTAWNPINQRGDNQRWPRWKIKFGWLSLSVRS